MSSLDMDVVVGRVYKSKKSKAHVIVKYSGELYVVYSSHSSAEKLLEDPTCFYDNEKTSTFRQFCDGYTKTYFNCYADVRPMKFIKKSD